jgi:hypothetical protein
MTRTVDGATPTDPRPTLEAFFEREFFPADAETLVGMPARATIDLFDALAAAGLRIVGPGDPSRGDMLERCAVAVENLIKQAPSRSGWAEWVPAHLRYLAFTDGAARPADPAKET